MARITTMARDEFDRRFAEHREKTETLLKEHATKEHALDEDPAAAPDRRVALAGSELDLAALYLLRNRLSRRFLGIADHDLLDGARGSCDRAVILLEKVAGDAIDAPMREIAQRLDAIDEMSDSDRYRLVRKMGFTIDSVEEDYEDYTRWRWYFVDLGGRFATVAKNLLNLRTLVAGLDPRVPEYEERLEHLRIVKRLLEDSARRFRRRYVQYSQQISDFRRAISFLSALRRVHALLGETDQAQDVKRKMTVWTSIMNEDERKLDENKTHQRSEDTRVVHHG